MLASPTNFSQYTPEIFFCQDFFYTKKLLFYSSVVFILKKIFYFIYKIYGKSINYMSDMKSNYANIRKYLIISVIDG